MERGPRAGGAGRAPRFADFLDVGPLAAAEKTFYRVGVDAAEGREVLNAQLANLERLARWIVAHVAATVVGDERVLTDRAFIEGIDPRSFRFDPDEMARRWAGGRRLAGALRLGVRPGGPGGVPARDAGEGGEGGPAEAAGGAGPTGAGETGRGSHCVGGGAAAGGEPGGNGAGGPRARVGRARPPAAAATTRPTVGK